MPLFIPKLKTTFFDQFRQGRTLFIICFIFALSLCHQANAADLTHEQTDNMTHIKHSQSDHNKYRYILLENGLKVLLAYDSKAEKAAAALAVGVGANDNPHDIAGLTHFLEHMLFLGTKKYPEADSYKTYIHQHGGSNNAYTAADHTNYFFDVLPSGFEGALDRFSQFFISPLFSEEYTQRERKAVHSEYIAKVNDDARRNHQALKTLFNPAHPSTHFSVGNLDTLKDRQDFSLREQLIQSYQTYYFAQNMSLSLVANLPLDELETLAKQYFSAIPSQARASKANLETPALLLDNTANLQFIKPVKDGHNLKLIFLVPPQKHFYKTQPSRYISYLLGQESQGSLYSYLKSKGWAQGLSAGLGSDYINQQGFNIQVKLTDAGIKAIDEVLLAIFATINDIKTTPINKAYIKEEMALSQLSFDYHSYLSTIKLARTLASQLLDTPATDVLDAFQITEIASNESVESLLAKLTPDNMLIQVASKETMPEHWGEEAAIWQEEPLYHSQYANLTLKNSLLERLKKVPRLADISAPEANPYIPNNFDLVDRFDPIPIKVFDEPGIQFWHRSDNRFDKTKSSNHLAIRFPDASETTTNYLLNKLWARLLNDALSESTYLAYNANLNYNIYAHINGLTLVTAGFNDKQSQYLLWLMAQINLIEPTESRFDILKQEMKKDLFNTKHANAYSVSLWRFSELIIQDAHAINEMLSLIDGLTFEDLIKYKNNALSHYNLLGYSNGNIQDLDTQSLAETLASQYQDKLIPIKAKQIKRKQLIPFSRTQLKTETTSDDNAVLYVLSGKYENDRQEKAFFTLFNQAIGNRFFSQLRTEKQLGYIVSTHNLTKAEIPAIGFTVQSPNHRSDEIIKEIENFIHHEFTRILDLPKDEFEEIRHNILAQLKRQQKELGEDTGRYWHEIAKPEQDFYYKEKLIETMEGLTQQDFNLFIEDYLATGTAPSILVHNQEIDLAGLKEDWQDINHNTLLP